MDVFAPEVISAAMHNLDTAAEALEELLSMPEDSRNHRWAHYLCTYSRFVHTNTWQSKSCESTEKTEKEIIPLLLRAQNAAFELLEGTKDRAESSVTETYIRNIEHRMNNLNNNYITGLPSNFSPESLTVLDHKPVVRPSKQRKKRRLKSSKGQTQKRNLVFFSYSRRDKEWLERVLDFLKPFIRKREISIWVDQDLKPGVEWRNEIKRAISHAKVAVLLVSPNFIASEFIANNELPPLLHAAENDGLQIIWIPISKSMYFETPIDKYQAAHDPGIPLDKLNTSNQNAALVEICMKIKIAATE